MKPAYATHEEYTNDAPRHLREIAGMTTAAEIADENKLSPAQRVGSRVHLLLHLKDDQLPHTWQEYKQWQDDTQHRLGLALGQYGLAISSIISPGDGNKEDWARKDEESRLNPRPISNLFSPEENAQRGFEELQSSKKVLVNIVTQDRHDHRDGENHFDHGATTAKVRLETFVSELEKQRQAPDSPPPLQGMAQIAEERRLGRCLNQSLKLFDDIRLAEADDHKLPPVNGALTLRMKLSEDGPKYGWKAVLKKFSHYPAEEQTQTALDFLAACTDSKDSEIKRFLNYDLSQYGLAAATGRFDKGNREFVFTVVETNRYNEFSVAKPYFRTDRDLISDKAFGDERPSPETLEKVGKYIDDFAQARQLSLGEVAARGL